MTLKKANKWLKAVNNGENHPFVYIAANQEFYCNPCEKPVPAYLKSQLVQHKIGKKHRLHTCSVCPKIEDFPVKIPKIPKNSPNKDS